MDGASFPRTELPLEWSDNPVGAIGCWRAHINVLHDIVENNVGSALILGDDADWDVSIKAQLETFAPGAIAMQNQKGEPSFSPYGDNWVLLWLGACGWRSKAAGDRFYELSNDRTVVPVPHRIVLWSGPEPNSQLVANETHYAWVMRGENLCTTGYAVSPEGARELLAFALHIL